MSRWAMYVLLSFSCSVGSAQSPLLSSHAPTIATSSVSKSLTAPVARINGVALNEADLRLEMQRIFPYYSMHGGKVPAGAESEIRAKALQELVLKELVYQEAKRRNLRVNEAELSKGLQEVRQGFKTRKAYEDAISRKFGSVVAYEGTIRRTLLIRQLWQTEVVSRSHVTAQELRTHYLGHKSQFLRPESISLQTISINLPKNATPEQKQQARERAEKILPQARAAKDYESFGVLAEQVSEDDWRVMMGDHKWVHRGTFDAAFDSVIFSMKAGDTSNVVESRAGFHIFRVNGRRPQRQVPYLEAKTSIRKQLEQQRLSASATRFEQALRSKAKVEIL